MVHELHKLGYQRIRIAPGMSPSGLHWRCSVTHVENTLRTNGALMRDWDQAAHYTSPQQNHYFDWQDATTDTARELAAKFIGRFPHICDRGRGADWPYAGWFVQILGAAERGLVPIAYSDWDDDVPAGHLQTIALSGEPSPPVPMPPPGQARAKGASSSKPLTTVPGYTNRNGQVMERATDLPGNDNNQRVYILRCSHCEHHYGANGSDIWLRQCPSCGGGAPGLAFE